MRFLKNKILKANEALQKKLNKNSVKQSGPFGIQTLENSFPLNNKTDDNFEVSKEIVKTQSTKQKGKAKASKAPKKRTRKPSSTKNLVINYGKAIASFATSHLAVSYLEPILKKEGVTHQEFIDFISQSKKSIGGIKSFRYLILTTEEDDERVVACKKVFREISTVFIKFFSVNWIMHGKVTHKITYLKYRFKMLRRIQDPENFTYVKQRIYSKKQI